MLFWPIYQTTQKAATFQSGPGQEKTLQQIREATWPYDPEDPVALEMSVADQIGMFFGVLADPYRGITGKP